MMQPNLPRALFNILFLFIALLAPLMFLVGVIAALDRYGTHQRFVDHLQNYGRETSGVVSYADRENGRVGVDFVNASGETRYGSLEMRYYPESWWNELQPGAEVRIRYIDAVVSEMDKVALTDEYPRVLAASGVTADVWWILLVSWLFILVRPQFTFLGMLDFDEMFKDVLV